MKYLCLVYLDEQRLSELPDADCVAYDTALRASGHCLASEALQSVTSATTVRAGRLSVTDGPFAETKEQLTGFYLIEAQDLNEAIRVAAGIPPACVGSIEVRPIRPIRETVARAAAPSGRDVRGAQPIASSAFNTYTNASPRHAPQRRSAARVTRGMNSRGSRPFGMRTPSSRAKICTLQTSSGNDTCGVTIAAE